MNTFYIARHGETENNRVGRLSGWIDTPLTSTGLEPTRVVIQKLASVPIDALYSSDLGRAFVTAYVVAHGVGFTKDIVRLPGLREVNYGDVANMIADEALQLYPLIDRDTNYTPPNGESLAIMQARILKTLQELDAAHTDETIVLITHSGVLAAINSSVLGQDFGTHNITIPYPHDYVARFTMQDGNVASFAVVEE